MTPTKKLRSLAARVGGRGFGSVEGADGWLFLRGDSNRVLDQHSGHYRPGRRWERRWRRTIESRVETIADLGPAWLCQVAPDKEAVYAEALPEGVEPASQRPVHTFLELAAAAGMPASYPLGILRDARGERPLYYKTDTHWNHLGAFHAYREICLRLARQDVAVPVLGESQVRFVDATDPGDLGSKLDPPRAGATVRAELEAHSSLLVADNRIANHGRIMVFEGGDEARPTCVAFGESFANHLLIFLKESFRRLVFVHSSMLDPELLRREDPDVVLTLPVERFLVRVPDDSDAARKLARIVERKHAEGRIRPGDDRFLRGIPRGPGLA